jgi:eukaryotic-like serine/threonine-protein kinase
MIKHVLSPFYKLIDVEKDISESNLALQNSDDDNILSLNPDIAFFIQLYQAPQYFSEIVHQFELKYQANAAEIEPIIQPFLDSMLNRGILISEEEALKIASLKREPPLRVGENIKGFVLEKRLSFSMPVDIYLAKNEGGKKFLIKILSIPPNATKSDIRFWQKNFKNEFDILKALTQSPKTEGICPLISFDKEAGIGITPFFENNVSLRKKVDDDLEKLNMDDKVSIFNQLIKILASIHAKNIVHGDLHTSNILINNRGEVCLIDFDLAIRLDKKNSDELSWGGALEFIPPENIRQNAFEKVKNYPTFLSEIFQLGVVGYFLFYEKLPFEGRTWTELAQAILHHNPNFESNTIPLSIQSFLQKILSKNPTERQTDLRLMAF